MIYELGTPVHSSTRIDRRTFVGSAIALGLFGSVMDVVAQTATPASDAEGDADALAVLQSAAEAILELDSFTFSLETINGSSSIFPGVEIRSIKGAVRRPMDVRATLTVHALIQTLTLSAVAVDGDLYIQNPLNAGAWENMGSAPEMVNMINPDWILQLALSQIQDAHITSVKDEVTLIEGYFDLSNALQNLDEESQETLGEYLAQSPVDIAFWINADNLITAAELYGPIFSSESADVEKRIELSDFNEPVNIEVPDM